MSTWSKEHLMIWVAINCAGNCPIRRSVHNSQPCFTWMARSARCSVHAVASHAPNSMFPLNLGDAAVGSETEDFTVGFAVVARIACA
jgi:hypothetical protein